MTFYEEISKLKSILRKGWIERGIDKKGERIESDAEHTFSMIMLALEVITKKATQPKSRKSFKNDCIS